MADEFDTSPFQGSSNLLSGLFEGTKKSFNPKPQFSKLNPPPISGSPFLGPGTPEGQSARENTYGSTGGITPGERFDNYTQTLSQDYAALVAERDRQVARSGSAAAAPYNRAIAKITAEIGRLQEQKARYNEIAGVQKKANQRIFGQSQQNVAGRLPGQIEDIDAAFEVKTVSTSPTVTQYEADLATIGVDEEATQAAATVVEATEEEIMSYTDLVANSTRNYVENVAEVTDKVLAAAEATRGFSLENERKLMEARVEDMIVGLIEQKQELQAKRAAAVSSARNATMAQFSEGLNYGQIGWMDVNRNMFTQEMISAGRIQGQDAPAFNEIVGFVSGSPIWDADNNLRDVSNLKQILLPEQEAARMERSDPNFQALMAENPGQSALNVYLSLRPEAAAVYDSVSHIDPTTRRGFMYDVIQGARVVDEAANYYNANIVGSDPFGFEPGSVLRAYSGFESAMSADSVQAPWEAWDWATSDAAHQGYTAPVGFSGVY